MRINLILALLLTMAVNVLAEGRVVTGMVFSAEDNEPLIGATVKVKGENVAAATDIDGHFTLNGVSPSAKHLEVSYVGCQPQTVEIKPDLKIYLHTSSEMLDEMIVVAFGKQKRESFTGSASVVGADQIARQQVTNPIEALNGTVTGLTMTETNSFSSDPSITIRGIGSLNASTSPLIVLDGMPYNGYWNDLNPADIASMTVLKDASANALYGARGANGVILITSKNAQRGQTKVNLTAKWGANTDGRIKYDIINDPGQYYEAYYLAYRNNYQYGLGQTPSVAHLNANAMLGRSPELGGLGYMVYNVPEGQLLIGTNGRLNPNATLGNRIANNGEIYTLYPDDWLKEGLRTGFRQEYNASLSSGNDRYTFYGSLGYLNDNGLAYNNDIDRYTARLKADAQAFPWLKVGASAAFNHTVTNAQSSVFSCLTSMAPIYPAYLRDAYGDIMTDKHGRMFDYGDGSVLGIERPVNPSGNYLQDDLLNQSKNVSNAFNIQGYATVDLPAGFHFTVNGSSYITENRINTAYNPYYGFNTDRGYVATSHYRTNSFNTQQLLNYSGNFVSHTLDVLLGHEYTRDGGTSLYGERNNPALYDTNKELDGAIIDAAMGGDTNDYNVEGWFIRAQYDFDGKYFASGSFRRDGSSRFHKKHRWGNFWSLGAAWILTKEDWFPESQAVDMLKLKISYGEQGNDGIGAYRFTDSYNISNVDGRPAFVFNNKGNENITWETVGSLNAGLEFELFGSRLSGGIEFYSRATRDMLMYFTTPLSIGYTGYYDNIGDMRNNGLELQLNADIIALKDFSWNVGLNLSWERNRVTFLPEDKKLASCDGYSGYLSGSLFYGEGLPVNTWRLRRYAGVNDQGKALYYYTDSDGALATTTRYESADYYLCGSALPNVFGGFNTSFRCFGVDLSAQFNYSIGGRKYDTVYAGFMTPPYDTLVGSPLHKDIFNAWTPEHSSSDIPMWQYGNMTDANMSDRFLTDASYIGLRNITLGYTFPKSILNAMRLSSLRIFCQAENIWYWTGRTGFDPRMGSLDGNYNSGSGYSFPMRTISGGLTVEF